MHHDVLMWGNTSRELWKFTCKLQRPNKSCKSEQTFVQRKETVICPKKLLFTWNVLANWCSLIAVISKTQTKATTTRTITTAKMRLHRQNMTWTLSNQLNHIQRSTTPSAEDYLQVEFRRCDEESTNAHWGRSVVLDGTMCVTCRITTAVCGNTRVTKYTISPSVIFIPVGDKWKWDSAGGPNWASKSLEKMSRTTSVYFVQRVISGNKNASEN